MPSEPLVTFNAYVGNRDHRGNLHALADDVGAPLVIAGQELKLFSGTFPGYERVDAGAVRGSDAAGNVLFVRRRGVTIVKPRIIRVKAPKWKGPKHGEWRDPRTFVGATLEVDEDWRIDPMCVHRTPGGPKARMEGAAENWEAEHHELVDWVGRRLDRHPDRVIALLGDWQKGAATATGPLTVRALARELDAQLLIPRARPAIDGVLLINATGRAKKLPGLYGGDGHRPVVVTVPKPKE